MPAKTCRRTSPPRLSVSFSSFLASGTSSAAITRATRRSTLAKSSIVISSATSGSACERRRRYRSTGQLAGALRRRSARRVCGRLLAVFDHGFDVLSFDSFHHVCELGDRRADQRLSATASQLVIGSFSSSPACSASCGSTGARYTTSCRNRFSATVQTSCSSLRLRRVLAQLPGRVLIDVRVGPVGQRHDQPHRAAVVAGFVRGGDLARRRRRLRRTGRRRRDTSPTGRVCCDELRRAAGEVHDLADEVGVHLGDELVEVQIEVVEPRAELRRRSSSAGTPDRDARGTSPP